MQDLVREGRVMDLNSNTIKFVPADQPSTTLILPTSRAILLFNSRGDFIIPTQDSAHFKDFLTPDGASRPYDLVFSLPAMLREGVVTKEDEDAVYLNDTLKLDKKDLVAIIYRNGHSAVYGSPAAAADVLAHAKKAGAGLTDLIGGDVPRKEFEEKAQKKTIQFTDYLKILCDKTASYEEINKAISQALTLFVDENAMVETSSNNRNAVSRQKIRDYLNKVKRIQYDRIEIEWTHVQYVSDLKPGPDGNFYGTVSFEQEFKGYRDGKLVYSDITYKNATVVLKTYDKTYEGTTKKVWDVLLSDIGVVATKTV